MWFLLRMTTLTFIGFGLVTVAAGCTSLFRTSPLEADPQHVQLIVVMPQELSLKKGDVAFTLAWQPQEGAPITGEYFLNVANAAAPAELPARLAAGQQARVIHFDQVDADNFRKLRLFILDRKARGQKGQGSMGIDFRGACWNGEFPKDPRPLLISAYIRMAPEDPFTEFLPPTDIRKLSQQWGATTVPSCVS